MTDVSHFISQQIFLLSLTDSPFFRSIWLRSTALLPPLEGIAWFERTVSVLKMNLISVFV